MRRTDPPTTPKHSPEPPENARMALSGILYHVAAVILLTALLPLSGGVFPPALLLAGTAATLELIAGRLEREQ
ncbi:hypothetical protein [Bifidobacterium leontopitheci]|uniref:Uncharacterized protein n=1 Tax=Bifidobacterium leontopitheci TaxID=2650774 RepID=A0A6I1GG01_9BIFI|nr:hypothetical protein [Bifidobacterium leontopitheci]KAB7790564.1 hypothetical protein F7D09_0933 [Bifidobacterium leontopitheci]